MREGKIIKKVAEKLQCAVSSRGFGAFGDDGFVLPAASGGEVIVLSTDSFVQGSHFTENMGYFSVGWKSLVSGLSDIFAMGARPSFYSLNLILPQDFPEPKLDEFLEGLKQASDYYSVKLLGGDVAKGPVFVADYQVGGYQHANFVKSNSKFHVGDVVLTDQALGEALLGFEQFKTGRIEDSIYMEKFLFPKPSRDLGPWLGQQDEVRSLTDISDGLLKELQNLCSFKNVKVYLEDLCVRPDFKEACHDLNLHPEKTALQGGEDYSLLWTVKPNKLQVFLTHYQMKFKTKPLILGRLGTYARGHKIVYENQSLIESIKVFEHFSS